MYEKEGGATLVEVPNNDMEIDFSQAIRGIALFSAAIVSAGQTNSAMHVLGNAKKFEEYILTGKVAI